MSPKLKNVIGLLVALLLLLLLGWAGLSFYETASGSKSRRERDEQINKGGAASGKAIQEAAKAVEKSAPEAIKESSGVVTDAAKLAREGIGAAQDGVEALREAITGKKKDKEKAKDKSPKKTN